MFITLAKKQVDIDFPTTHGDFRLNLYEDGSGKEHLALIKGDVKDEREVLVRLHSKCLTGDVFGSLRCDCCSQLNQSLEIINENGKGILLYLNQEGRGIGLKSKIHSYKLQDKGYDTVEANRKLGYKPDARDYDVAASILKDMNVKSIKLLSNNPDKIKGLEKSGIEVKERVPLNPRVTEENIDYLKTKANRLNHQIDLEKTSQLTPERQKILRFFSRQIKNHQKNKPVTLFYKQNLSGELIENIKTKKSLEKNELKFLEESLKNEHDKVIHSLEKLDKEQKDAILLNPDPKTIKKAIKKDLIDLFLAAIFPNEKGCGVKLNNQDTIFNELNYSKLGKILVIYGSTRYKN